MFCAPTKAPFQKSQKVAQSQLRAPGLQHGDVHPDRRKTWFEIPFFIKKVKILPVSAAKFHFLMKLFCIQLCGGVVVGHSVHDDPSKSDRQEVEDEQPGAKSAMQL